MRGSRVKAIRREAKEALSSVSKGQRKSWQASIMPPWADVGRRVARRMRRAWTRNRTLSVQVSP